MHSSHHLPLLLWLPLLLLLATSGTAGTLTEEEKTFLVDAHNMYRTQTNPPAANMLKMRWDENLAKIAKDYAKLCVWAHNPKRGRLGENLFAIAGDTLDMQMAISEWHREQHFFNFTTDSCQSGQMCGHYTQVVWAKSEKIGCGSHLCPKLKNVDDANVHFLVCNYAPPGNVVGQKLYEVGPPCSACPTGYHCEQSLCGPRRGPEEPQDLPCPVTEAQTSLATETSGSSTLGAPSSLVTEAPSFLVTEGPVPLATKTLPAVQTEAPSSLVTKDLPSSAAKEAPSSLAMKSPLSMATEATPSETTEVPAFGATHSLLSLFERTVIFPISTQAPSPKSEDKGTGRTRAPSQSPERLLTPKMPLIGTPQPLLHAQKTGAVGPHQWAAPSEVSASVLPAPDDPSQEHATLVHLGHTSSRALPHPSTPSAPAQAVGGRVLALHSSLPVSDISEEEPIKASEKPSPAGSNPGMPNPLKPSAEETVIPLGPGVTGLIPAGPSVEGPTPAGPGATVPISFGAGVEGPPIPLGPGARGLIPAGPSVEGPSLAGPRVTGSFLGGPTAKALHKARPSGTEPKAVRPSHVNMRPAETPSEELNPTELEELGLDEKEAHIQKVPEKNNMEDAIDDNPDLGESYQDEAYQEDPNMEDVNVEDSDLDEEQNSRTNLMGLLPAVPGVEGLLPSIPGVEGLLPAIPGVGGLLPQGPNAGKPKPSNPVISVPKIPLPGGINLPGINIHYNPVKPTPPRVTLPPRRPVRPIKSRCVRSPFRGLMLLPPLLLPGIF